jgi:hypothetical protein
MSSIEQNRERWGVKYTWTDAGDEWSAVWGGVDMQWHAMLWPRLHAFVPTSTILEIAPGYGRWTQYLKDLCDHLIIVDLVEKCIEHCQARFADSSNIAYHVNDGKSLDMMTDGTVDFAFSFDSLVHADRSVIQAYITQLSRKLTQDGVAFIHHSNLGDYTRWIEWGQRVKVGRWALSRTVGVLDPRHHGRAQDVTAALFRQYVEQAGMVCISQELVNWKTRGRFLIDCMTVFTPKGSKWARPTRVLRNPDFMREASYLSSLATLYEPNDDRA